MNSDELGFIRDVYNKYVVKQSILKHSFHILDLSNKSNINWNSTDNKVGNIEIRHLWKNQKIVSFEEFCNSPKNNWHSYLYWKDRLDLLNTIPNICKMN